MQLKIDALKQAAAWPGTGQRARPPGCAGRAEADLESVLAAKDQFPPGSMRAAQERWTVSTNDQDSAR
jgi:hypothetical protein